ncbi:MAG: AraC family transcriptional regulator [Spirochaetota bacterium]
MVIHHWGVHIATAGDIALPRTRLIYESTVTGTPYRYAGKDRSDTISLFQYTISGSGMFSDERGERSLSEGEGFLVNHNDPSYVYWYPKEFRTPWVVLWASFEGGGYRDMVAGLNRAFGRVFSLPRTSPIIRSMRTYNPGAVRTIQQSASESARIAFDLLIALAASTGASLAHDAGDILIRRALELLNADAGRLFTSSELAARLSVSREHLSRVFRERLKTSPYDHIIRQKMELAKIDLRYGGATVQEIARRYGFPAAARFSSLFRSIMGMTPREWRKRG